MLENLMTWTNSEVAKAPETNNATVVNEEAPVVTTPEWWLQTPWWTPLTEWGGGSPIPWQAEANLANKNKANQPTDVEWLLKDQQEFLQDKEDFNKDRIKIEWDRLESEYKTDIASDTAYYDKKESLIKKAWEDVAAIQDKRTELIAEREARDLDILAREKENIIARQEEEIALAKQEQELQKVKDDNAIIQAQAQIEIDKQKSAWAFNKLWLWFSSWIILQSQNIATQWAAKIAELKVQASYNQAKIWVDIAKLMEDINKTQIEYTKAVNSTIDKYTDLDLQNEADIIDRINTVNDNLLLNSKDKQDAINKLKKEYRQNKLDLADKLIKEQEDITDKQLETARAIEAERNLLIAKETEKTNTDMETWNIMRMTPSQISQKEIELNLPQWTLMTTLSNNITVEIRKQFDNLLWKDYSIDNISQLVNLSKELMKQGRSFEEAISQVVDKKAKTTELYTKSLDLKQTEINKALKWTTSTWISYKITKFDDLVNPDWVTTSHYFNPATNQWVDTWVKIPSNSSSNTQIIKVQKDWKDIYKLVDKNTSKTLSITDEEWNDLLAPVTNDLISQLSQIHWQQ